jgi:uncharacterized protein (DUF2249 family)
MTRHIDGRDMVPPEPLELALAALDELPRGEELVLLLFCHPFPLFEILGKTGFVWTEVIQDDGTHEIRIRHK